MLKQIFVIIDFQNDSYKLTDIKSLIIGMILISKA